MNRPIGKQIMRGLGFASATILLLAATLIVMTMIQSPSDEEEIASFIGPGRVIETESGRQGLDSHFWARYECDPTSVRERIKSLHYPSRNSQDRGPHKLIDHFINPGFRWPSNIKLYTEDWIEFKTGPGNYIIVAFPDDDSREVFFLKWDV